MKYCNICKYKKTTNDFPVRMVILIYKLFFFLNILIIAIFYSIIIQIL